LLAASVEVRARPFVNEDATVVTSSRRCDVTVSPAKIAQSFSPRFLLYRIPPRREHRIVDVVRVDESQTMLSTSQCRPAYKMEKYGLKPPPK